MIENILYIASYGMIGSWGLYHILRCLNGKSNNTGKSINSR